jgi:predicted Zn finger-like uncharacterized protein
MALATQCPHCHTTFRVAHDQLKLRAGLVRCGSCKEIFNGIEHLLPSETAAATRTPAPEVAPDLTPAEVPAPSAPISAAPAPAASQPNPPAQPSISDQLDFAYPDMGDDEPSLATPAQIPDTVIVPHSTDPVEVEFVETPRKTPLATPAIVDPEPAYPLHSEPPPVPASAEPSAEIEPDPADPLTRMTLIDVEEEGIARTPPDTATPDPLDRVMEDFERPPAARAKRGGDPRRKGKPYARSPIVGMQEEMPREEPSMGDVDEPLAPPAIVPEAAPESYSDAEEPDFVKRERYQRTRGRSVRIAMNLASALMLLLAVGQATYSFRDQLAARLPEARPALQGFCSLLGCKIGLPEQIDSLLIESGSDRFEKLNTRKDTSELTLVIHNTANVLQAWPQLELTLKDELNKPLARRVFSPQEYLPAGIDQNKGFSANAEQPVKLYIEFADTQPASYSVGLFYR